MAGAKDNIIPAHLNRRNYKAYAKRADSVLEYIEFPSRNHLVLGQKGWEGNADYALSWIEKQFAPAENVPTKTVTEGVN